MSQIEFVETLVGVPAKNGWLVKFGGSVIGVLMKGRGREVFLAASCPHAFADVFAPLWPSLAAAQKALEQELERVSNRST